MSAAWGAGPVETALTLPGVELRLVPGRGLVPSAVELATYRAAPRRSSRRQRPCRPTDGLPASFHDLRPLPTVVPGPVNVATAT
jgi:hypothetical protein